MFGFFTSLGLGLGLVLGGQGLGLGLDNETFSDCHATPGGVSEMSNQS